MENCSFTKFKGVVDNPSLKKYGQMDVIFNDNKNDVAFTFTKNTTIWITNGTIQYGGNSYTSLECTGLNSYHIGITLNDAGTPAILSIGDKYSIQKWYTYFIGPYNINIEDFMYSLDATEIQITSNKGCVGNIETLKDLTNLTRLSCYYTNISGSVTQLPVSIKDLVVGSSAVEGRMSDFAKFTNIWKLNVSSNIKIRGTVEEFAEGLITAGRTSGTVRFVAAGWITYQGNNLVDDKAYIITFSGGSYTFAEE